MGLVYELVCMLTFQKYFGSTGDEMSRRAGKGWRTCSSKNFVHPIITILEDNLEYGEYQKREKYYIQNFECVNKKGIYTDEEIIERKKMIKKRHYQKHIETFKLKSKEKIKCNNCGKIVNKPNIRRHEKTNKCMSYNVVILAPLLTENSD